MTDFMELNLKKSKVLEIRDFFLSLQKKICTQTLEIDNKKFSRDVWNHAQGGGGITCVLEKGNIFERCGINFSHVYSDFLGKTILDSKPELKGYNFEAMGVSVIMHPNNPYIPTSHMNVRFFLAKKKQSPPIWWFGGGFDLTPFYGFESDVYHWHNMAYNACKGFGKKTYYKYKEKCDEYFYLPHRNESRGVGGIFFDHLNHWGFEKTFEFVKSVGNHYSKAYFPIVKKRRKHSYSDRQREFQLYRRGRYIEFNLLYDKGTSFGLNSQGRVESILMSIPPFAKWIYNYFPIKGSDEEKLYTDFLPIKNWIL